eukprot:12863759-Alexandrium_andersonii.AAC.1
MLISAAIHLNPQSAMRQMRNRFRRSNLEQHGPKNDSNLATHAAEGCVLRNCSRIFRIRRRNAGIQGACSREIA